MTTSIDPLTSLTVSMQAQKGVYALLLGSGISHAAGVPTGWGVVNELITRLAKAQNQDLHPDPEAWYRHTYGKDPNYSELLKELAPTRAARLQVLREFFEPTEEEREEGLKAPTPAHRAIAELVAQGYVRVIVTTNFDRLMEQAIADEGVQPSVISGPASAKGALPLIHAPVTIVKVHGDYLDTGLLNTEEELGTYKPAMKRLLDRILDEFGLIVCGWSATWDPALRNAIEGAPSRRFQTYWAHVSEPSEHARSLRDKRAAVFLPIKSADDFFERLKDGVLGLSEFRASDPIESRVAVARAKRFLSRREEGRIALHDLVQNEADHLCTILGSEEFSASEKEPSGITPHSARTRIYRYERASERFAALMACGSYWSKQEEDYGVFLRAFRRTAEVSQEERSFIPYWKHLHHYPALYVLYGAGVSAVAAGNYALLKDLLYMQVRTLGKDITVAVALDPLAVIEDPKQVFPGSATDATAVSAHIYPLIRPLVRDYAPSERDYQDAFFFFEYIWALVWLDLEHDIVKLLEHKDDPNLRLTGGPLGVFAHNWSHHGPPLITEFSPIQFAEGAIPGRLHALPRLGFFGQSESKMRVLKIGLDRAIHDFRRRRPVGR